MDETDEDTKQVQDLRKISGLPKYKPGKVSCLKCDKEFKSWDVRLKRICGSCSNINEGHSEMKASKFTFKNRSTKDWWNR